MMKSIIAFGAGTLLLAGGSAVYAITGGGAESDSKTVTDEIESALESQFESPVVIDGQKYSSAMGEIDVQCGSPSGNADLEPVSYKCVATSDILDREYPFVAFVNKQYGTLTWYTTDGLSRTVKYDPSIG